MTSFTSPKPRPAKLKLNGTEYGVPGGLDFSAAEYDPVLGKMCIMREELVETLARQPRQLCVIK